ncbi:homoprotocatechuate degradation operon regulator HpaR [Marinomonas algicola]|jgi:homoprotocatechuate degradation regulator HpaR|uniref:homoprotocatechuate degradation operon regulator HpaR n=1 Tax=Marinomonas algicola TaxID=2773454 RepID=UPI00174AB33D|nr:homoprotocatechuate degradation operon regulator HpaR [Marinomonas algicola]
MKKLEDSLTLQLLRARESAMMFFRPILQETGFTEQQWRVIRVLNDNGQLEARQLAEKCCILSPSLTRIISRFEKEGLLIRTRSSQDQRITLLSLSEEAKKVFDEISPKVDKSYEKLTEKMGKEKMKALSLLLKELTELESN